MFSLFYCENIYGFMSFLSHLIGFIYIFYIVLTFSELGLQKLYENKVLSLKRKVENVEPVKVPSVAQMQTMSSVSTD